MTALLFFHQKQALRPIRIGIRNDLASMLIDLAKEKEFFKNNGLDVEIKQYGSGKLAVDALFRGEIDVAAAADVPIAIDALSHDDFSIISTISEARSGIRIVARRNAGIVSVSDLRGKRIAVQESTAMHYFLSSLLLYGKIPESDVEVIFLSPTEIVQSLIDGKVDALSIRDPYVSEVKQKLANSILEFYGPQVYLETYNLVAKNEYIKNNKEVLLSFLQSILQANNFLANNTLEAKKAAADKFYNGNILSVDQVWEDYAFGLSLNQSLLLSLENEARWWVNSRGGEKNISPIPNFLNFIYKDFLIKLDSPNVTIIR